MNNYKYILLTAFFLWSQINLFGQYILPEFQSQAVNKNELLVRWEPKGLAEWQSAITQGYQVKVYMGPDENNLMLKQSETVKPLSVSEWDNAINREKDTLLVQFYEGAKQFLYMEKEMEEELKQVLVEEDGKTKQETVDEFKLGYLVYSITFDMQMIEMAGLGFKVPLEKNYAYRVEVSTKGYEPYVYTYNPLEKKSPNFPDLEAEFGNKKVTLKWPTPEYKENFFAYYLAISDNGKRFENVNDLPYYNMLDTVTTVDEAQYLTEELPLDRNYKDYWFRIRGMNYFGIESSLSSIEKGYGFEEIDVMPTVNYANQTADNDAEIKWTLDRRFNRLIDHFAIYRSDELDGEYTVVYDSISVNDRMVRVPMEHSRNYFSVAIVPKDGREIRSFSVFVMGQDTVAPVIPQNFVGVIDSMGVVTLTWDQNQEEDLWGYKVFRSEYIDDEFGPLHPSPIIDTTYVDTVNLNSLNEAIHYSIIALDKRNNRSEFSAIVSLERPDTIAPTAPLVREVDFLEDSIKIVWAASSSKDAILHQLFRKESTDNGWTIIAEFNAVNQLNSFVDTDFEMNKTYFYTAIAKDDMELSSAPSRAMSVQTLSKKPKNPFLGFDISFDEENVNLSIRWNLDNENDLEEIIVYRGPSKEEISMYKIVEPDSNEIVQDFADSEKWFFVFKPVYNDGSLSSMSDIIIVEQPN